MATHVPFYKTEEYLKVREDLSKSYKPPETHIKKSAQQRWMCRNCGYMKASLEPLSSCPMCAQHFMQRL